MSSFKIHNLEENQMYFKNISLHFTYLSNKLRKILFLKKKFLQNCYFILNKTSKSSIWLQNLMSF